MAAYNVEVRQRISGLFDDIIYPKANWNNMDNKPATFPPTAHSHGNLTSEGRIGSTSGLAIVTTTNGDLTTRSIADSASAGALGTSTDLVTERDIYYGTPTINTSKAYNSNTAIFAPTASGTTGQLLVAVSGAAPQFVSTLTGIIAAQNNTSYTTKQIRNITLSTNNASGGNNGDIWIKHAA